MEGGEGEVVELNDIQQHSTEEEMINYRKYIE